MSGRRILLVLLGFSLVLNVILTAAFVLTLASDQAEEGAGEEVADVVPTEEPAPPPSPTPPPSPSPSPSPPPTTLPSPTPTAQPTEAPTTLPDPTATPEPSPSPTPMPSPTFPAGPDWLRYLNSFRQSAGLPPLVEEQQWTQDSGQHSKYMVNTGQLWHSEDPNSEFYSEGGNEAAKNGLLAVADSSVPFFHWAFNYWMSAPFHGLPILDPTLQGVGFAIHRDENGLVEVAATMDIKRGQAGLPENFSYPVVFPGDGDQTWILRYSLPEFPFALASCPGYTQPSGPPIIVQIGAGEKTPRVTNTALLLNGQPVDHCHFDETTYFNENERMQAVGRNILDARDAIIIMPRRQFEPGQIYEVMVEVDGEVINWQFETVAPPEYSG